MAPPEETPLKLFQIHLSKEASYTVLARDVEEARKSVQECPDIDDWVDAEWDVCVDSLEDRVLLDRPDMDVPMAVNRSDFELVNIVDFDGPADWRSQILERAKAAEQAKSNQPLPGCG